MEVPYNSSEQITPNSDPKPIASISGEFPPPLDSEECILSEEIDQPPPPIELDSKTKVKIETLNLSLSPTCSSLSKAANSEDFSFPSVFSDNPSYSLTRCSTGNYSMSKETDQIAHAGNGNTINFADPNSNPNSEPSPNRPASPEEVTVSEDSKNLMLTQPDRVLHEIVSESVSYMAETLQDFPKKSLDLLKDFLKSLMDAGDRKEEFTRFQRQLEQRSDITAETLTTANATQLRIMVAIKTGVSGFLSAETTVSCEHLIEIFMMTRCRNLGCKSVLPADDCDCKFCANKKGFCSSCMCLICLEFDYATNTCSWVGCDVCSHWCHAICGLERKIIRPGPNGETQFMCPACDHPSEMFGFVKEVISCCAKDWGLETLLKELECVRNIFNVKELEKKVEDSNSNAMLHLFNHGSKPEIPSSNVNIQLVQENMHNSRITELELEKSHLCCLEPHFHNKYNGESSGQSYGTTSEEEQMKCRGGGQISNFRDEWLSLEVLYSDIKDATNGLSESSKIGQGGYGSVYKGKLGRDMVAIKMLDSTSKQGQNEFFREIEVLYQMRHPNLVKLVGACFKVQALIYEFIPNGSLEDCLKYNPNILTWQMHTRIIYEICLALIYLHSKSVVHGDLKPANILLDANFKSKLSDFGLCRFLPEDMTSAVYLETVPKGTSGYIDPWFLETWILRPGSDLYSFGITILKLLTGMPPVGLGVKACDADESSFQKMIDPTAGSWPFELAKELLYWSLQCCYHNEKSSEILEDMSTCLEEMLIEIETLQQGRFKVAVRRKKAAEGSLKAEEKKGEESEEMKEEKTKVEEKKEHVAILKVHMHCEDCAQEIKRRILRMKGVEAAEPELKASQVTVKGVFDQLELVEYVHLMTGGIHVTIVKVKNERNDGNAKEVSEELWAEESNIEHKRNEFYHHPEYAVGTNKEKFLSRLT